LEGRIFWCAETLQGGKEVVQRYDKVVYTRGLITAIWLVDAVGNIVRQILAFFSPFWRQGQPFLPPRRLLVLRTEQIGDVLLTTPALRALRESFPDAYIAALVQKMTAPLLQTNPHLDEVIACSLPWCDRDRHPIQIRHPLRRRLASIGYHWRCLKTAMQVGAQLRKRRFDVAISFGGHPYDLLLIAIAGCPVRIASPVTGGAFLLTHMTFPDEGRHEVERCLDIVALIGAQATDRRLVLRWTPDDEAVVTRKLQEHGIKEKDFLVAIHSFSVEPSRNWRVDCWASVAQALIRKWGATVLFVGSSKDREKVAEIQRVMGSPSVNLCGELSLLQLGALFERCALMIGVDSAPAHIAAAVGTPVVSVWSSAYRPEKWAPPAPVRRIVAKSVPCADCRLMTCPLPVSCMDMITPEEVIAAVEEVLSHCRREKHSLGGQNA
jgi:ADP-heptose:LPS heptosyltransferase